MAWLWRRASVRPPARGWPSVLLLLLCTTCTIMYQLLYTAAATTAAGDSSSSSFPRLGRPFDRATGLLFPNNNNFLLRNYAYKQRYSAVRPLRKFDWREYGILSPVADQDMCGACYAYAVVHAIEALFTISSKDSDGTIRVKFAELQAAICGTSQFTPGSVTRTSCSGGWITEAYSYATTKGLLPQAKWESLAGLAFGPAHDAQCPIDAVDRAIFEQLALVKRFIGSVQAPDATAAVSANAQIGRIQGWESVPPSEYAVVQVVANQPAVALVHASSDWKTYNGTGGKVFTGSCSSRPEDANHAVLIVGYTETTFIIKNSWGNSWGDSGYMHLPRRLLRDGSRNPCGLLNYITYPVLNGLPPSKRNEMLREGTCAGFGKVSADMGKATVMGLAKNLTDTLELSYISDESGTSSDITSSNTAEQQALDEYNALRVALTYDEFLRVNTHLPPDPNAALELQTSYYIPPCTRNPPRPPVPRVECGTTYRIKAAVNGTGAANQFADGPLGRRLHTEYLEERRRQLAQQHVDRMRWRRLRSVTRHLSEAHCGQTWPSPADLVTGKETCSSIAKKFNLNWSDFSSINKNVCPFRTTVIPKGTSVCVAAQALDGPPAGFPPPSSPQAKPRNASVLLGSSVMATPAPAADTIQNKLLDCGKGFISTVAIRNAAASGLVSDVALTCSSQGSTVLALSDSLFAPSTSATCETGFDALQVMPITSSTPPVGFGLRCSSQGSSWVFFGPSNAAQQSQQDMATLSCDQGSRISSVVVSVTNLLSRLTSGGRHRSLSGLDRRQLTITASCTRWWPTNTTVTGTETCGVIARTYLASNLAYLNAINNGICPTASTLVPRGARLCIMPLAAVSSGGNSGSSSGSASAPRFSPPPPANNSPRPSSSTVDSGFAVTRVDFYCSRVPTPSPPLLPPRPRPPLQQQLNFSLGEPRLILDSYGSMMTADSSSAIGSGTEVRFDVYFPQESVSSNQTWLLVPIGSPARYLIALQPTVGSSAPLCVCMNSERDYAAPNILAVCDPSDIWQLLEISMPESSVLEIVQPSTTRIPRGSVTMKYVGGNYKWPGPYLRLTAVSEQYIYFVSTPSSDSEDLMLDYEYEDDNEGTTEFEAACPGDSYIIGISGTVWWGLPELLPCMWKALEAHKDGPGLLAPLLKVGASVFQTLDFTCSDGTKVRTGRDDRSNAYDPQFPLFDKLTSYNWSEPSCPSGFDMVRADTCEGCMEGYRFRTYFRCQGTRIWTAYASGLLSDGELYRNVTNTAYPDTKFIKSVNQLCAADAASNDYVLPSVAQLSKLQVQSLSVDKRVSYRSSDYLGAFRSTQLSKLPLSSECEPGFVIAGVFGRRGNLGHKFGYTENIVTTWIPAIKASYARQSSPSFISTYNLDGVVCRKKQGASMPISLPAYVTDEAARISAPAGMTYIGSVGGQVPYVGNANRTVISCGMNAFVTGVFSISSTLHITKLGIRCSDGTSASVGGQNQFDELGDNVKASSYMEYACPDGFESVQRRAEQSWNGAKNGTGVSWFAMRCGYAANQPHNAQLTGTSSSFWAKVGNPYLVIQGNAMLTLPEAAFTQGAESVCKDGSGIAALAVEYQTSATAVNQCGGSVSTTLGRRRQLTIAAACSKWWPLPNMTIGNGTNTCGAIATYARMSLSYINTINGCVCPTAATIVPRNVRLCIMPPASVLASTASTGRRLTQTVQTATTGSQQQLLQAQNSYYRTTLTNYYIHKVHVYCGRRLSISDGTFLDISTRFGITFSDLIQANQNNQRLVKDLNVSRPLSEYEGSDLYIPQICGAPAVAPPVTTLGASCTLYWPLRNTSKGTYTCGDVANAHLNRNLRYLNEINNQLCPTANTVVGANIKLCITPPSSTPSAIPTRDVSSPPAGYGRRSLLSNVHHQMRWPHSRRRHLAEQGQGTSAKPMQPTCYSWRWATNGESCDDIATQQRLTILQLSFLNAGLDCSKLEAGTLLCVHGSIYPDDPKVLPLGSPAPYDVFEILGMAGNTSTYNQSTPVKP